MMIASIAVGYNHPKLYELAGSPEWRSALINRPALGKLSLLKTNRQIHKIHKIHKIHAGIVPNASWKQTLTDSLLKVAPNGLSNVFTAMCGSCANEIAMKAAFIYHQKKHAHGGALPEDYLSSCMSNESPVIIESP
jgi:4-aminobutyrate aminotransferase / (S)-3-amino-2-methylpropionate transaminase